MTGEYDENTDTSQTAELYGPERDGLYTSQLHDWIPLCPQLRDSSVRLYWTLRALVVEKHGPVRKLTLLQICYLLPAKPVKAGEKVSPSSLARVRSILAELSDVGLISTPEGGPIKTSSRASASAAALRIRINDKPRRGYRGPRNAFAQLDDVRKPAAEAATAAIKKERERAARKRAERAAEEAGQISSPPVAGQISSPVGQISSPLGQISSPHSGPDLQDHEPPFIPSAQSSRSDDHGRAVRPSVQVEDVRAHETDGRTGAVDSEGGQADERPPTEGCDPAAVDSDTENSSSNEGGVPGPAVGDHRPATPGAEILRRVARRNEELTLAGKPLTDQARRLDGLLLSSHKAGDPWMPTQLIEILSAPLNEPIRRSAGAVISGRITRLPATPNAAIGMLPWQATGEDRPTEAPSQGAAERSVDNAITRRTRGECPECRNDSPGGEVCGDCLGWPKCVSGCGRAVRNGGTCERCEYDAHHATIAVTVREDGTCPGHGGKPCGKRVQTLGLCGACRIKAETDRNSVIADFETARDQIVAASKAAEERQPENAPF